MSMTLEINKVHIRNLILSFLTGFLVLFVLEHFGEFSYKADYVGNSVSLVEQIPMSTKVLYVKYQTFFDNTIQTSGNGWSIYDLNYTESDFRNYTSTSYYYTQATIMDFKYGIYISFGIFVVTVFFSQFKIKLT